MPTKAYCPLSNWRTILPDMQDFFLVGTGGFAGAVFRYYFGGWVFHLHPQSKFPLSTLLVNLIGCLLIGSLGALAHHFNAFSPQSRLFIFTGVLGGFTTFSAFGFETFYLLRNNEVGLAILNVLVTVCFGLFLVWLGDRAIGSL